MFVTLTHPFFSVDNETVVCWTRFAPWAWVQHNIFDWQCHVSRYQLCVYEKHDLHKHLPDCMFSPTDSATEATLSVAVAGAIFAVQRLRPPLATRRRETADDPR